MNSNEKPSAPTADDFKRIAEAVQKISDTGRALAASGLNRRAVVLLLQDATGVRKTDIELILNALPKLRDWYLKV